MKWLNRTFLTLIAGLIIGCTSIDLNGGTVIDKQYRAPYTTMEYVQIEDSGFWDTRLNPEEYRILVKKEQRSYWTIVSPELYNTLKVGDQYYTSSK